MCQSQLQYTKGMVPKHLYVLPIEKQNYHIQGIGGTLGLNSVKFSLKLNERYSCPITFEHSSRQEGQALCSHQIGPGSLGDVRFIYEQEVLLKSSE